MDRRAFMTYTALFSGTLAFGQTEEFIETSSKIRASSTIFGLLDKLNAVQDRVGYVQFNLISFDQMLKEAAYCNKPLTTNEIGYIETIFYGNPKRYGFYGERTVPSLTSVTPKSDIRYIDKSGHSLLKGAAIEKYTTIKRLIGDDVLLTSGIRAPVKQLHLFVKKMVCEGGDLRATSTSIAPPGFTFHSIGDFDIGKMGFGQYNFTEKFQETDVFKKLYDHGYITIRYPANNSYGVRYEPWHIKVTGGNETA